MPDRIDIDALLIGALYGELTPADEARLTAHLESHPADRTALSDLARTRAAVRDSRLLAVQLEPPQAISALLLQEASRRAPRPDARGARDGETASWFQRFVRSFMAHPAMAAAAMLVLVVGVAGTFYVRGTALVAEGPPPALPSQVSVARNAAAPEPEATTIATATPPTGTAAAAPEGGGAQPGDRVGAGSAAGAVAGSDGYRVDLDDVDRARLAMAKQDPSAGASAEKTKAGIKVAGRAEEAEAPAAMQHATAPPAEPAATRDTRGDKPTRSDKKLAGILVQTPELSPRELKESDDEVPDRARRRSAASEVVTATGRITRGAAGAPGGGAPAPAAAMPEPPPSIPDQAPQPAPASEPKPVAPKAPSDAKNEAPAKKPVPRPMPTKRPPSAPVVATPPPPPANDGNRFAGKAAGPLAKDTAGSDKVLVDWARKRHEQVKTLVSSNNCRAAASAATEIYRRAPDYYAANVVTDRTIKPCLAYINTERERQDRVRAAKNAAATDSAAPAPPPARK